MANQPEHRDFFISFNLADKAYADALAGALAQSGFTFFHWQKDEPPNLHTWQADAIRYSSQTLSLVTPEYMKAEFSLNELFSTWAKDPNNKRDRLKFLIVRQADIPDTMTGVWQHPVEGQTPGEAARTTLDHLKRKKDAEVRHRLASPRPLRAIHSILYRANPNFSGRADTLEQVRSSLAEVAAIALTGTEDIGKTTLAAEYCHRFGGMYAGVWWIRAEQRDATLERRGLDFEHADAIFAGATYTIADERRDYGEDRFITFGLAGGRLVVLVWTPRGDVRHIISMRKANDREQARYARRLV